MTSKKVVAIIQARMGSTRLPGKTLADIAGKSLLGHVIERVKNSHTVDDIVVATTVESDDQAVLSLATEYGVKTYAGNSDDVLDRYYQAARKAEANLIVRVTADDPFKDPEVLDKIVHHLLTHPGLDYASNTLEPTYPEGLDIEVFTFEALERAWSQACLPSEREHVTPYIWKNGDKFKSANVKHHTDLSHLRWTLDYEEDLRFTREVYARLYGESIFLMQDILDVLQAEPDLVKINQGIERNTGYLNSLKQEGV
jgi:spore coat polysaccharide biosynthesis protein SpsF